jgi:hypothetical protein
MHSFTQNIRRKRVGSASSLYTLYTDNSTQIYSAFLSVMLNLTLRYSWKYKVLLCFFAEYTRHDPKNTQLEDNANFHLSFVWQAQLCYTHLAKTVSDLDFWISGPISKRFLKILDILCWISISDWVMQKKLRTDHENFFRLLWPVVKEDERKKVFLCHGSAFWREANP